MPKRKAGLSTASRKPETETSLRYELICGGAVKLYLDGREVCFDDTPEGQAEYKRRTMEMAIRQRWVCGICKDPEKLMHGRGWERITFQHSDGRGMGGARRNDSVAPEAGNCAAHLSCNSELGSRRVEKSC
jgi:hypothetical protein